MRILLKGKSAHIICKTILKHGPLTVEQGIALHGAFHRSKMQQAYDRALDSGWLTMTNGVYSLRDDAVEYVSSMPEPKLEPRDEYVGQIAAVRARIPETFRTAWPSYQPHREGCEINPRCNGRSGTSKETLIRGAA